MKWLKLISAISIDGAIGHDDNLLWHLSEDLKRYKNITMNNIVIVGMNTFMGMPAAAFKGRTAIVVCGDIINSLTEGGSTIFPVSDPQEAIDLAEQLKEEDQEVYVIGGSLLYESIIDEVEEAEITWVNKMYPDANKRFPIDKLFKDFDIINDSSWDTNDDGIIYKFTTYKRIKS